VLGSSQQTKLGYAKQDGRVEPPRNAKITEKLHPAQLLQPYRLRSAKCILGEAGPLVQGSAWNANRKRRCLVMSLLQALRGQEPPMRRIPRRAWNQNNSGLSI